MDEAEGRTKRENMEYIKEKLLALTGVIPEIKSFEVGFDIGKGDMAYDMALVCEFDDMDALERYKVHPEHVKVSNYVVKVRTHRAVVDYQY